MAAFECLDCGQPALAIRHAIELPADSRSDEIDLQLLKCGRCGLKAAGIYEESRRGDESIDHYACRLNGWWYWRFKRWIRSCPGPRDRRCDCATHRRLGAKDSNGRLQLFQSLDRSNTFPLTLASPARPAALPAEPRPATSVGSHGVTVNEIGLLGFHWPPPGVDGPAFQPDAMGRVNLDRALEQLRESLSFWQREYDAAASMAREASRVSYDDDESFSDGRAELSRKVARLCEAVAEVERLIARLDG